MNALTMNDAGLVVLRGATSLAEIRDVRGTLVGFFAPASIEHAAEYARAAARLNPQELRRRREARGKTYTTAEVLEHLKSLETT